MSIAVELPPDIENEFGDAAREAGVSMSEYLTRWILANRAAPPKTVKGAEAVALWQHEGIIGMRPDIVDSHLHARDLRARAEDRDYKVL